MEYITQYRGLQKDHQIPILPNLRHFPHHGAKGSARLHMLQMKTANVSRKVSLFLAKMKRGCPLIKRRGTALWRKRMVWKQNSKGQFQLFHGCTLNLRVSAVLLLHTQIISCYSDSEMGLDVQGHVVPSVVM